MDLERSNSRELAQLIIDKGVPANDASTQLLPYRLSDLSLRKSDLDHILDDLTSKVTKSRDKTVVNQHRSNIKHLLLGTLAAAFDFKNVAISTRTEHHQGDQLLGKLGFDRRRLQRILPILIEEDWIRSTLHGYRSTGSMPSKSSQYFAGEKLLNHFSDCLYEVENDMVLPCYHKFNEFPLGEAPALALYEENEALLCRYNLFMAEHSWAKKGPTTRAFSKSMDRAGRLHNAFQNIVNRRVPIRKSTLIDGSPMAEPDFSCNHLRMASKLVGEDLSADPYSDLVRAIGGDASINRNLVKKFITVCIGATSLNQKGGLMLECSRAKNTTPIPTETFRAMLEATEKLFPWINKEKIFFNDAGARMQKLEGEIGLRMFKWALNEEVPMLSVHDAFAVKEKDKERTMERMKEEWIKVINKEK
jgi:hypothetical protein|tara:strand:- start:1787 stop:3040 length:1254 start_codon:yes stop_codon:yes gene_type:complete